MPCQFTSVGEGGNTVWPGTVAILGSTGNERLKSVKKGFSYLVLTAHASRKFNYILMTVFCAINVVKWPVREMVSISPCISFLSLICVSIDAFNCMRLEESLK